MKRLCDVEEDLAIAKGQYEALLKEHGRVVQELKDALKPFAAFAPSLREYRSNRFYSFMLEQEAHPEHLPVIRRVWPCDHEKQNVSCLYARDFERAAKIMEKLSGA